MKQKLNNNSKQKITFLVNALLITMLAASVLWIFLLSLTPISSKDALIMHMSFPKIWAQKDFFYFQDFNLSTVSMMNLDYVYMLILKFLKYDQAATVFHALMLAASGLVMFFFLKRRLGLRTALIFSTLFLLIPINQKLATEAIVDLGVLCFSTLSTVFFIKWLESDFECKKSIFISAFFSGLSVGTKYTGAILSISIIFSIILFYTYHKKNLLKALALAAAYGSVIIIVISPWMLRNYTAVGNPFYPLLNSVFHPDTITVNTNLTVLSGEYATRLSMNESLLSIFLIPVRLFFCGSDDKIFAGFDGVLNPFLLIMFIPLLFKRIRKSSSQNNIIQQLNFIFLAGFAVYLIYGHIRIRYLISLLPILIVLNSYFFDIISKKSVRSVRISERIFPYILIAAFLGFNLNYSFNLYKKTDINNYLFGKETKEEYLERKIPEYTATQKINKYAPQDAVIYEVLCGHRTYYIDRTVVFDDYILDRYLFNMIDSEASAKDYLGHFSNLPFRDIKKADYLMIKPNGLIDTFKNIFILTQSDSLVTVKTSKFAEFLNSQKLLFEKNGTFIYLLQYGNE